MRCDPADGEVLVDAAAAAADDHALELLHALTVALDHPHADAHRVSGAELRQIVIELPGLDFIQDLLRHFLVAPLHTKSGGHQPALWCPPPAQHTPFKTWR